MTETHRAIKDIRSAREQMNDLMGKIKGDDKYKEVVEFTPIINAYYHFANWAQTSGGSFNDWYLNKNGYRNTANVFE